MRGALLVLSLLLVLPNALAQDAMPPRGTVWTVMNTVEATVQGNYAVVKVIADIGNRGPDPEFPFLVRIPDDAFVTGLIIERDGEVFEARIEDRQKAREEYEAWKSQGQTGGLVEKQRRSQLYQYLVNVAEFTSVRATLTYERYLAADRGIYNLSLEAPVSGFGEDLGARFDVRVLGNEVIAAWGEPGGSAQRVKDGYVVTHDVGPRAGDAATPFQVGYALAPTDGAGEFLTMERNGTGYFVHRFRAPSDAACGHAVASAGAVCADQRQMPVDLVLVLDVSGSMTGLKMQQMQDAAAQVVQQLGPEDRLHLALFSGDATATWPGLRPMTAENRRLAADEIRNAFVAGGTNLESAIHAGFAALQDVDWREEEGRLPAVVILTDGQPTVGLTDRAQLRQLARDANQHHVNVFAIAFGGDADWSFVHGIAADGEGVALRVPEGAGAEVDIRRFMQSLTTPVLKDVRVAYPAHAQASRTGAPILFAGSELLVVGTYDPTKGPMQATVTARSPDGLRTFQVNATPATALQFLPRVVAYHQIARLQDLISAEGERPEWAAEVARLGLQHGYVTDYTSLVVTLEPRASCGACFVATDSSMRVAREDASDGRAWMTSGAPSNVQHLQTRGDQDGGPATRTAATMPTPSQVTPTARVPGPGLALVALAVVAATVLLARRRG